MNRLFPGYEPDEIPFLYPAMPILSLFLKYWQVPLVAVALGFGALMWHEHNVAEVGRGIALERARVADSTLKSLKPLTAKAETLFVHDTVKLSHLVSHTDTLRDTVLKHLQDTIYVKAYIQASDSTIKACTSALHDCATVQALLRQQVGALETKLAAVPVARPRSCVNTGLVSGLLGALGGLGVAVIARHP